MSVSDEDSWVNVCKENKLHQITLDSAETQQVLPIRILDFYTESSHQFVKTYRVKGFL